MFFAFSFMRLPAVPDAPPRMSTAATLTGIFFEPTRVFRNLRAHPHWLAAILIVGIVNAVYTTAFYRRLGAGTNRQLHCGQARAEPDQASA